MLVRLAGDKFADVAPDERQGRVINRFGQCNSFLSRVGQFAVSSSRHRPYCCTRYWNACLLRKMLGEGVDRFHHAQSKLSLEAIVSIEVGSWRRGTPER
jgi:hypothetical protein